VLEGWTERHDQVLENVLRAYPMLTREKVVDQLKAAGFY
jgi:hypothetical protein